MTRRYLIAGRVQGVGFRWFTQTSARRAGVSGWVRNLPDGRVEIEAAGATDAMLEFERDIRVGPAGARVDDVTVEELAQSTHYPSFTVR